MDTLEITALTTKTRIGVHAWEKKILQTLIFDIHLPIDCASCNETLENTIDYDALCQHVITFVEANTFSLIETVAERVAALIKHHFPTIRTLTVRVSKPHAVPAAKNISVSVTR